MGIHEKCYKIICHKSTIFFSKDLKYCLTIIHHVMDHFKAFFWTWVGLAYSLNSEKLGPCPCGLFVYLWMFSETVLSKESELRCTHHMFKYPQMAYNTRLPMLNSSVLFYLICSHIFNLYYLFWYVLLTWNAGIELF